MANRCRREQALLESAQNIIFQFPVYWFSCPPLLRKYFDDVFTHGWAYGSKGGKLKGKRICRTSARDGRI
ncbi:NAD(P)H-dependent oxidoreductase [Helicobacter fennelliae]|uniref:NAD(P)H-dependent oxidoreductase n=1 Tax=Helicobacter fennelliae TaxID=215 RepID=UPI00215D7255|nr:NAD(P)H-dependent oxidoreductase [Helicobacter fennelliae]